MALIAHTQRTSKGGKGRRRVCKRVRANKRRTHLKQKRTYAMDERRTGEYRTGVVVKELALSEELRNKHGEIYSAMPDAMNKTPDASDTFAEIH